MYNNKKKILIAIGIIIVILSIIGVSYALWTFTGVQKKKNLVQLDCFNVQFNEITGSNIQLLNAFPLTDSEGQELDPYKFSISNECANYASYQVRIEIKEESKLDDEFLKVMLNQNTPKLLKTENYANSDVLLGDNTNKAYIIETGYLNVNETKDFDLRLWLDESVTTDTRNKDGTNIQKTRWSGIVTISSSYAEETEIPVTLPTLIDVVKNTETVESEEGLYKVTHDDLTPLSEAEGGILTDDLNGWKQTEYRYAGPDPNNYVWFNSDEDCKSEDGADGKHCELWRIIGLVNVKVDKGNGETAIDQRLKIIKADPIKANDENFSWDYGELPYENDWTQATLMEMLNDIYYESHSGSCYQRGGIAATCDFTSTGLKKSARDMIDKDIIWNIGGWRSSNVTTSAMFGYERGKRVYNGRPATWEYSNTKKLSPETDSLFHSVGLMYPSDYGYAVGGTSRDTCLTEKNLSNYNNTGCHDKDWLATKESYEWFLSPGMDYSSLAFVLLSDGHVDNFFNVSSSYAVRPVVYLNPNVIVTNSDVADGSVDYPYELALPE